MPIDDQFYKNLKPMEQHQEHIIWGPGKQGAAFSDEKVKAAYSQSGQNMQPLGIHGTFVAVDWDDCIADGGCLPVCPVAVFEWLQNPGKSGKDERAGYADKSDPVREADCIFCMACVTVCPTTAIKIDQSLVAVAKQQPASAQEPSTAQKPEPAAQQPAPAPAQQPAPVQQPVQPLQQPVPPLQPQASTQPATQPSSPAQQQSQQLALQLTQLTQLAQQLTQLAQELAKLAQQTQQPASAEHPASPTRAPTQAPAPAQQPTRAASQEPAPNSTTTKAEKNKVPSKNLPSN